MPTLRSRKHYSAIAAHQASHSRKPSAKGPRRRNSSAKVGARSHSRKAQQLTWGRVESFDDIVKLYASKPATIFFNVYKKGGIFNNDVEWTEVDCEAFINACKMSSVANPKTASLSIDSLALFTMIVIGMNIYVDKKRKTNVVVPENTINNDVIQFSNAIFGRNTLTEDTWEALEIKLRKITNSFTRSLFNIEDSSPMMG